MPTRNFPKNQQREPIRDLQILLRLSNINLGRIAMSAVVRHQIPIVVLIFLTTLLFTVAKNATSITLPKQVATDFFSAVSQSLAALLGVLIVFLTFTTQSISQRRHEYYYTLQIQIDSLIRLTQALPLELMDLRRFLLIAIGNLVPLHLKDFPLHNNESQVSLLSNLLEKFENECTKLQQQQSFIDTYLYVQQILLVIHNMEEIIDGFSTLYWRMLEMSRFVLAIAKLSFLLGLSLMFLLLFGIVGLQNKFPDLSLPVVVFLAISVSIALLELVRDTWFLYRSLQASFNIQKIH
jgi:hypothetical protein